METYLYGPMDYANKMKMRYRMGTWSRQKEGGDISPVGGKRSRCTGLPPCQSKKESKSYSGGMGN